VALNHLHLHVADLATSRGFYETFFGFRHDVSHGPIEFLADETGFQLALAPGPVEPMPSWWHFGFRLPEPGAVRDLGARLAAAGHDVVETGDDDDLVRCKVRDPDGYLIEVYWE
jgi:catechol 2,3-dioxygenase-like lactoylglutathione lyase family enzyme